MERIYPEERMVWTFPTSGIRVTECTHMGRLRWVEVATPDPGPPLRLGSDSEEGVRIGIAIVTAVREMA